MPKIKIITREATRAELLLQLKAKVERAKPIVKALFFTELQRSTKKELQEILKTVKVSHDGWDITS